MLEELRSLLDGFPVETQFHNPFRVAVAEDALWRGDPEAALASVAQGLRETEDREWPRYQMRIFRVGIRAAADLAEVARARRDVAGEAAAVSHGEGLWAGSSPSSARPPDAAEASLTRSTQRRSRPSRRNARACSTNPQPTAGRRPPSAGERRTTRTWSPTAPGARPRRCSATANAHRPPRRCVEAYRIATGLGARPLTAHIEALAARSRLDLSPDDDRRRPGAGAATGREDPFGLTRRERDVLPLLVKGRTNRQIAEELFISENTAGVHVSNILGKLGATTRTEAAGIAARLGLGTE